MLHHHTTVNVSGEPSLLQRFRDTAFTTMSDSGKRRPMFTPEWILPMPEHVARWNDSYLSDRLAAQAMFLKAIPPEGARVAADLGVADDYLAFANQMGAGRQGLIRQMIADTVKHGNHFAQRWIDNNWGSVIDHSSTVVYQCRPRELVFAFDSYGCRPAEDFLTACRGHFGGLSVSVALEPPRQAVAA